MLVKQPTADELAQEKTAKAKLPKSKQHEITFDYIGLDEKRERVWEKRFL